MEEQISNPASERVVLSGIIKHGSEAFIDVDDIIDVSTFTLEQNQIIYTCLKKTYLSIIIRPFLIHIQV